jgi:hypothetical protein
MSLLLLAISTTAPSADEFYNYYAANLRAAMFTGFFTLTGFLFAVKAFLVVNMKKELCDTPEYQKEVVAQRQLVPNLSFYGPLNRLSRLLLVVVLMSLLTSLLQFSLGLLVKTTWAAVVCLAAGGITAFLLTVVLLKVRSNLKKLFGYLEDNAIKKHYPENATSLRR